MPSLHVVETMLVVIVMFGSVALVTIVQNDAPSPWTQIHRILDQRTWEALHVANDHLLPGGPCKGDSMLEQLLFDGVQGDKDNWSAWRDKFFAPGYRASLHLDNGPSLLDLHGPPDVLGSAHTIYYDSNFTYALTVPAISTVSGLESLPILEAGVRAGQLLRIRGEALESSVHFFGITPDIIGRSATSVVASFAHDETRLAAQDVGWTTAQGDIELTRSIAGDEANGGSPLALWLDLRGPQGGMLPAGLAFHVRFPPGWTELAVIHPDWTGSTSEASLLHATLNNDVAASRVLISARAPNTLDPFEVIHARLGGGSLGESTLVLRREGVPLPERDLPRLVYPTTPYPVKAGGEALFGAVFVNGGADAVTVDKVEFHIPGGYDLANHLGRGAALFDETRAPEGWTIAPDGRTLSRTFEPGVTVDPLGARAWTVMAPIAPYEESRTSIEPVTSDGPSSTLTFGNGFTTTSTRSASAPGILLHRAPPADAGETNGYPTLATVHKVDATIRDLKRPIPSDAKYRVLPTATDVTDVENALSESRLLIDSRLVPLGSNALIRPSIETLVDLLAELGAVDIDVKLDVYSPVTRGCPTVSYSVSLDSLPEASVQELLVGDDGPGVDVVYAAVDDGRVYRIEPGALALASFAHEEGHARLLQGAPGGVARLFVATEVGKVRALDPTTMQPAWTRDLAPVGAAKPSSVAYDATRERVLVGFSDGRLVVLDAALGDPVHDASHTPEAIDRITIVGDKTFIGGSMRAYRLDANYAYDGGGAVVSPATLKGFGALPARLVLAERVAYHLYDGTTLAYIDTHQLDPTYGGIVLTAQGDADDDGVDDLVFATDLNVVGYFSGTDGLPRMLSTFSWTPPAAVPPISGWGVPGLDCRPTTYPGTYSAPLTCGIGVEAAGPRGLHVEPGRTTLHLVHEGRPILWSLDAGGNELLLHEGSATDAWTSFALGHLPHLTERPLTFVTGSSAGIVEAREFADPAEVVLTSTPTSRLGEFLFYVHMPEGGFYGSHVVVLTVSWKQAGKEQAGRLMDWYEVVQRDGTPHPSPMYQLVLAADDAGYPIRGP